MLLVREAIRRENLPIEVYVVSDGEKAIEFLKRAEQDPEAPHPHVALLDLNLPKKDGFEVLRRLRGSESWRGIAVLIITSSDSPRDRSQAGDLGAGYFRKPTSYDEFLKIGTVVREILVERGLY